MASKKKATTPKMTPAKKVAAKRTVKSSPVVDKKLLKKVIKVVEEIKVAKKKPAKKKTITEELQKLKKLKTVKKELLRNIKNTSPEFNVEYVQKNILKIDTQIEPVAETPKFISPGVFTREELISDCGNVEEECKKEIIFPEPVEEQKITMTIDPDSIGFEYKEEEIEPGDFVAYPATPNAYMLSEKEEYETVASDSNVETKIKNNWFYIVVFILLVVSAILMFKGMKKEESYQVPVTDSTSVNDTYLEDSSLLITPNDTFIETVKVDTPLLFCQ